MKSLVLAYRHILSILVTIVVIGCALPSSESNENAHNEALNAILHEASEATNKGRYEEAEGHYLAALEKIGTSGDQVLSRLHIIHNLARIKAVRGKISAAENLYLKALALLEDHPGKDGIFLDGLIKTLGSLGNLALSQSQLEKASQYFERIIQIKSREPVSLRSHDGTLASTLAGIAKIEQARGNTQYADSLSNRGLGLKMYAQGFELYTHDDFERAESMFRRALSIQEKILGINHVDLAVTSASLALLLSAQNRYTSASPLLMRAVQIYKIHPNTEYELADCLFRLADNLRQLSQNAEADRTEQQAKVALAKFNNRDA